MSIKKETKEQLIPFGFELKLRSEMYYEQSTGRTKNSSLKFALNPAENLKREAYLAKDGEEGLTEDGTRAALQVCAQAIGSIISFGIEKGFSTKEEFLEEVDKQIKIFTNSECKVVVGKTFKDKLDT